MRRAAVPAGLWLALAMAAPAPAGAVSDPGEMLADPAQEARAERVGSRLRCLVCQNESIEDSDAKLAGDLRRIVRQQVRAGRGDAEIVGWMVARYGQFVRLQPPFGPATLLLWAAPLLALAVGGALVLPPRRRAAPAPLSAEERAALSRLRDPS